MIRFDGIPWSLTFIAAGTIALVPAQTHAQTSAPASTTTTTADLPTIAEPPPPTAPPPALTPPPNTPQPAPVTVAPPAPVPSKSKTSSDVDEIVVTGSRIPTSIDNPATVLRLDRTAIDRAGLTSIADILQQLPVSGGALNTRFNSSGNFGFPPDGGGIGAGAALVDLRYLGPKRVLVLVDGVRWVNGSSASGVASATDLNTIPASIIERIEILQDGASPIYGSDAIAGVVNIITRKESQGISANAYIGAFGQGDGVTQQYDLGWGQTGEETSVFFNVSYTRQGDISAADRAISRFPLPNFDRCTNNCSSGTPQGRFFLTDPNTGESLDLTINNGAVGDPRIRYDPTNPTGPNSDFNAFDTEDRFNFAPFNFVQTPNERLGIFAQATHKISEEVTLFGRALYNNRRSRNQAAPEPLFIGSEAGNGNRLDTISVDATNIYNPFGFTVDASSPYFFGRRPLEAGPRIFEQNVDTWYVAGGLKGNFGIGDIDVFWDATALYTRNRADQIKNGAFNSAKLQIALGPNDLCMAEPGCVPFNFFGGQGADGQGTITQEMLDYVSFVQKDVSEQQMWDVVLNLGANLIELPGGDLSIAVGYEHRDQSGFFRPDAVVVAGDSAGVPSSPTSGRFSVNEAYAEIVLPLVKGVIGADLLDLSSAIRISDYSTFGLEETFKVGMRWRPFEDLLIRGTFAQGFRAPGIGELFGSASRFDQTLNDPCSDLLGSNGTAAPENVRQNCIQQGVPADGSYQQFNPQISVTTGGNRELDPETSDSWTATMAYSPWWLNTLSWVQQFSLELTYYRISVEGAIQAIDAQVQLDRCAETGDPVLCAGISRTGEGTINGFANRLTNIGEVEVDGFDIVLSYSTPDTSAGRFGIFWPSSFLFNFTQRVPSADGFEVIEREGREVGDPEQAFPQFKSSLIISWVLDRWSAFFTNRYIHSVTEPCRGLEEFPDTCSDPNPNDDSLSENKLEARLYTDLQVSYRPPVLDDRLNISVGVNNLFNQDPPACYSCALNGFDATTYLVPGVFGYVRAAYTTN